MSQNSTRALVWGAGGFVGRELLRLLATHSRMELGGALSSTHEGKKIADVYPGLTAWGDQSFSSAENWDWEQLRDGPWILFSSLPHGQTMTSLPKVLDRFDSADLKIVDLSGDFRLPDAGVFREYYHRDHLAPEFLDRFVYGLPELQRDAVSKARCVANPGCFATGAQLALLPLAASSLPVRFIAVDGKTGSSGAGAQPRATTHHPNRANNFKAYGLDGHRHFPEIQNGWLQAGGTASAEISFLPQMAPLVRGIFTSCHIFFDIPVEKESIRRLFDEFYDDSPFIRMVEESPALEEVWGTNRCDLSVAARGRHAFVCSAIDNLVKGAAGQAVQNANLMSDWNETLGLNFPAPWPV